MSHSIQISRKTNIVTSQTHTHTHTILHDKRHNIVLSIANFSTLIINEKVLSMI